MFSPVSPILPSAPLEQAAGDVLLRVEAITTVLAVLARMAGGIAPSDPHGLGQHADLSAAVADMDDRQMAYLACELDAVSAALQAGFIAIEAARKQGHAAQAAARILHSECRDALSAVLGPR